MSVTERNGRFLVRWRDYSYDPPKQRGRTFATAEEAHEFDDYVSSKFLESQRKGEPFTVPEPESPTFGVYARLWFDELKTFSSLSTEQGKRSALATTGPIDDIRLDELKKSDIERWIRAEFDRGQSPGSIRTYYRTIREIYNHALDDDVIPKDRLRNVSVPKAATRKSISRYVTPEKARAIAEAVQPRYSAFFLVEYLTALRWSEVAALTVDSIRVWVTDDRHVAIGKVDEFAGLDGFLVIDSHLASEGIVEGTKTKTDHTVPVDEFTLRLLADHIEAHPPGDGGLVFSSTVGSPLHSSNWSRDVTPLAREVAGPEFTGHDLRNSALHDIEQIAGVKVAADLANHSVASSQTLSYTFRDVTAVEDAIRQRGLQVAPVLFDVEAEEVVA